MNVDQIIEDRLLASSPETHSMNEKFLLQSSDEDLDNSNDNSSREFSQVQLQNYTKFDGNWGCRIGQPCDHEVPGSPCLKNLGKNYFTFPEVGNSVKDECS